MSACSIVHIINGLHNIVGLKRITLPPKQRKRGRPKGADKTVIGLPLAKNVNKGPLTFLKKLTRTGKEVSILFARMTAL